MSDAQRDVREAIRAAMAEADAAWRKSYGAGQISPTRFAHLVDAAAQAVEADGVG